MAFKKAKALQEAHKYVTEGKNALAIRQYLSVLKNDPTDLLLLNTIGDLYIREKNLPEGLKCFYRLGEAYVRDGFTLKAIAIFKKIAKLDRIAAEPSVRLAELYRTQGLVREAQEQYSQACEFYRRSNQQEKALEILRNLAQLDSGNPRRHLELAQLAESLGEEEVAAAAYQEAAGAAERSGEADLAESARRQAADLLPVNGESEPRVPEPPAPASNGPSVSVESAAENNSAESRLPPPATLELVAGLQEGNRDSAACEHPAAEERIPKAGERAGEPESCEAPLAFRCEESREEVEFYLAHGLTGEAEKTVRTLETSYSAEPAVAALRRRIDESKRPDELPSKAAEELSEASVVVLASPTPLGPVVDLAAELSLSLGDCREPPTCPPAGHQPEEAPPAAEDAGLGALLNEIQAPETSDTGAEDPQMHYNLGVAFHEMGLHDEAIGEFQRALRGAGANSLPPEFLPSCTRLASCFVEKQMPAIAARWYERALRLPGLEEDAVLALRYELGSALEQAGDREGALQQFTEVYSQNIDYRDVAEKIRKLRRQAS